MIAMDITIHTTPLPHTDPEASLAFYRDALGFEVRNDVGQGAMRWITVGPAGQPGTRQCREERHRHDSGRAIHISTVEQHSREETGYR